MEELRLHAVNSSAKLQFSAIKTKLKNQKTSKQHSIAVMNQKNSYLCHIIINTNTIISAHIPRMDVNKVLYISQEIEPYLPASPLASFGKNLPQGSLQELGAECELLCRAMALSMSAATSSTR